MVVLYGTFARPLRSRTSNNDSGQLLCIHDLLLLAMHAAATTPRVLRLPRHSPTRPRRVRLGRRCQREPIGSNAFAAFHLRFHYWMHLPLALWSPLDAPWAKNGEKSHFLLHLDRGRNPVPDPGSIDHRRNSESLLHGRRRGYIFRSAIIPAEQDMVCASARRGTFAQSSAVEEANPKHGAELAKKARQANSGGRRLGVNRWWCSQLSELLVFGVESGVCAFSIGSSNLWYGDLLAICSKQAMHCETVEKCGRGGSYAPQREAWSRRHEDHVRRSRSNSINEDRPSALSVSREGHEDRLTPWRRLGGVRSGESYAANDCGLLDNNVTIKAF